METQLLELEGYKRKPKEMLQREALTDSDIRGVLWKPFNGLNCRRETGILPSAATDHSSGPQEL